MEDDVHSRDSRQFLYYLGSVGSHGMLDHVHRSDRIKRIGLEGKMERFPHNLSLRESEESFKTARGEIQIRHPELGPIQTPPESACATPHVENFTAYWQD